MEKTKGLEEDHARTLQRQREAENAQNQLIQRITLILEPNVSRECTRCLQIKNQLEMELKKDTEKTITLQNLKQKTIQAMKALVQGTISLGIPSRSN